MANFKEKSFLRSIRRKVIAAFLIGAVALGSFWVVTRLGFTEMLYAVKEVSAPNEKLQIVNNLFHHVSQLDQLQKVNVIRKPAKASQAFKQESAYLIQTIDSLRQLSAGNALQLQQLDSMQAILRSRDKLLKSYLDLRADFVHNDALTKRINAISKFIAKNKPKVDSSIITTNQKVTTTTVIPTESQVEIHRKQPFLSRLFGGRKGEKLPPALKYVEEELKVQVDTLSVARQDSALWQVEKMMRRIEREQHARTTKLLNRELALVNSGNQLHKQLLVLLHTIEAEEIKQVKQHNRLATEAMNASIGRINIIMICFFIGAAALVYFIFIDISRSHKYRRQLLIAKEEAESAREEAEQLGRVKQRFLANMSHEIRTPLQAILGFAEQVRHQKQPEPAAVAAIYQSSEHLLQIVNEVLDYSRIVSDKFTLEQQPFCMQQLITEVIETMRLPAQNKNLPLRLESSLPEADIFVGDAFRLRQILYNLLGNAIKFTAAGEVKLIIRHQNIGEHCEFSFEVKDTGIGIPAAELDHIFNSFEQANASVARTHGGTGLGLSIVKTLIQLQGGNIFVESQPGVGSSFRFNLTYAIAQPEAVAEQSQSGLPAPGKRQGKILVVDDDAFILQLCAAILQKHQLANICTSDALAVANQVWDEEIKLVLLDIRMPQLNGLELCQTLRQRIGTNAKIYALTAQALPEERDAILAQGFDGILMKPFREQELLALVQQHLPPLELNCAEATNDNLAEPDLAGLLQMTGGNEDLLDKILHQFIRDTQQDLENLNTYLEAGLVEPISELVHRLAGRTGQMGAVALAARLRAIEAALNQQEPLAGLLAEIIALQVAVKELVKNIQRKVNSLAAV
ncbi:ATP-binding protein [Adhaeribacter rhizoryzae]|uniref:histidine kinase n=1 Tax=Adhaeribacter rhizoryzae TaxID=2607907 RepID=A0A5M6DFU7_9BACT|nr:ATP-binding protein [Adhaeribacter rhizoryzae]KAA5546437.1 response regulator [Adhaeribacter rhizoryzae]